MRIPLGKADYSRSVAQIPDIPLYNRFHEVDPTNQEDELSLLCRPGLRKWLEVGDGPIRGIYSQPGTFDEALFVVSGGEFFRIDTDETITNVETIDGTGAVTFAATDDPYLFFCDGGVLWLYVANGFSTGALTASGNAANNDTVTIGTTVYKFTTGSVDTGTPDGSAGNPWLVSVGADAEASLLNLFNAINDSGTEGTDYSTVLEAHADVIATMAEPTFVQVRARVGGAAGDAIVTTETGATLLWVAATLTGGGGESITQVPVPDNLSIISVCYIASFVICLTAPNQGFNGRFFWIEPFENTIDALNFATAESQPDSAWEAKTVGDQFWLPGQSSIEVWYPTGDELIPFLRQQGRVLPRGIWEGTILSLKDSVLCVGTDGAVYDITDAPRIISTHAIAQRFREAINAQRAV